MSKPQQHLRDHPELLGFRLELERAKKLAVAAGNKQLVKALQAGIDVCKNPPNA